MMLLNTYPYTHYGCPMGSSYFNIPCAMSNKMCYFQNNMFNVYRASSYRAYMPICFAEESDILQSEVGDACCKNTISARNTIGGELDNIRTTQDTEHVKEIFNDMIKNDKVKALSLINEDSMLFGSLFILYSEIEKLNIFEHLNLRNKIAINIIKEILSGSSELSDIGCSPCNYLEAAHSGIRWMLVSGAYDDGLDDTFDKVIDSAASLLVKVYSDKTVLPVIADLIFKRNIKGLFHNDLVWVFFEAQSPESLILLAEHFKSPYAADIELAYKLLRFIPNISRRIGISGAEIAKHFNNWIEDNILFLYYTGESFQQSINPTPYRISLEAKYLCKVVSVDTGNIIESIDEEQYKLLKEYSELDTDNKSMLSSFSYDMHKKNLKYWNKWIRYSIAEQIAIAEMEGEHD